MEQTFIVALSLTQRLFRIRLVHFYSTDTTWPQETNRLGRYVRGLHVLRLATLAGESVDVGEGCGQLISWF